jgi:hypothetical protein
MSEWIEKWARRRQRRTLALVLILAAAAFAVSYVEYYTPTVSIPPDVVEVR